MGDLAGNLGCDDCPACDEFLYCIKTADQILAKAVRKPLAIGESGH